MSSMTKSINWLTVQFFLEPEGVCEVSLDRLDYTKLRCTCPTRRGFGRCRHMAYVLSQVKQCGTYSIQIPDTVPDEHIENLMDDAPRFRHMLAHSARVVVLDA